MGHFNVVSEQVKKPVQHVTQNAAVENVVQAKLATNIAIIISLP